MITLAALMVLSFTAQWSIPAGLKDSTTGEWLFINRKGEPIKAIKKGFAAACARADIKNLRQCDLRHTFLTRLLEQGVHHYVISALLGHATPMTRLCLTHDARLCPCNLGCNG